MKTRLISEKGEWTCPKCGKEKVGPYACSQCGFRIYAGFFIRLYCQAIDGAIVWLVSHFLGLFQFQSLSFFWMTNAASFLFFRFYFIVFTGLWGQTPGKMLAKIKVIRADGTEIRWSNAILRNIFETILVILINVGYFVALSHTTTHNFDLLSIEAKKGLIERTIPAFVNYLFWTRRIYAGSEFFVLLLNKRKRAIHDFIAGTVIIRDPRLPFLPWQRKV